jgi:glycosyltransferase involved in cell wall biosynthesis
MTIRRKDPRSSPGDRLRIAVIGEYPVDPQQIWGGVQSATAYLVRGLSRMETLDVHVLTFKRPDWKGPDQIKQGNVTVHLMPLFPRFERLRNYRTYQSILNHKIAQIQPDLLHAQDTTAHAYVALRSGVPTVVTIHGVRWEDGKYYSSWGRRVRNTFDSLIVEREVIRRTHHLIAICRYVTEYYGAQLPAQANVSYIPNAIDDRFFQLENRSTDRPVVLFAGRIIPRKRVLDLVKAFADVVVRMPSALLRLAGECSSEPGYVESLRRFIHQAGLEDNIQLLGPLDETALSREFSGCNLVVVASSQETAPMVLAQAMAAGKPVVGTRVGGIPEMIGENGERGLLVAVGDVSGLARAMRQILGDPQLQASLGQSGRAFACQNYSLDDVAQRTYEVYQTILAREKSSHD